MQKQEKTELEAKLLERIKFEVGDFRSSRVPIFKVMVEPSEERKTVMVDIYLDGHQPGYHRSDANLTFTKDAAAKFHVHRDYDIFGEQSKKGSDDYKIIRSEDESLKIMDNSDISLCKKLIEIIKPIVDELVFKTDAAKK